MRIELTTPISAPIERCFDLSRSIDLHVASTHGTGERAIAGVTTGLIGLDETVTWKGRPLGLFGKLVEALVLRRHLRVFLEHRNDFVRQVAESAQWKSYLSEG